MTCYVDQLRSYPEHPSRQPLWCHLVTDGDLEELHALAAQLGIPRERFQHRSKYPHYDLPPTRRALAIELGAVAISSREMVRILRAGKPQPDASR